MEAQSHITIDREEIVRKVRSQAMWLLGWGIAALLLPLLNSPFGIVLIIAGLASYYFGTASMLLVQAVIFLWAAVFNLFIGGALATIFSVILFISVIQSIRQYRRYRSVESEQAAMDAAGFSLSDDNTSEDRATWILPASAILVAGISWAGFAMAVVFYMSWFMATGEEELPPVLSFMVGLFLELGALALAFGLASVFSGYRYKALSILGALGGAGVLILAIFFATQA